MSGSTDGGDEGGGRVRVYEGEALRRRMLRWMERNGWATAQLVCAVRLTSGCTDEHILRRFLGGDMGCAGRAVVIAARRFMTDNHNRRMTFDEWIDRHGALMRRKFRDSEDAVVARLDRRDAERAAWRRQWLARERRGCGPGAARDDPADRLDAATIAALSGGTLTSLKGERA